MNAKDAQTVKDMMNFLYEQFEQAGIYHITGERLYKLAVKVLNAYGWNKCSLNAHKMQTLIQIARDEQTQQTNEIGYLFDRQAMR